MKLCDVFVPVKSLLILGWFLILCVIAPTIAAIVLIGGTGWAIWESTKGQNKGDSNGRSNNKKRPEYPC